MTTSVLRPATGGRSAVGPAALAVAASYLAVRTGAAEPLDDAARRRLSTRRSVRADRLVGALTDLGSVYGLAGVAGALTVAGRRRAAGRVAIAGTVAWTAAQAAKPLLHRPRPYESGSATRLVAVPAGTSWPSGHAAVAAAMTAAIAPDVSPAVRVALATTTVSVGLSRLHVGVHHLTDVVAGVGVGVLSAAGAGWLQRRLGSAGGRWLQRSRLIATRSRLPERWPSRPSLAR